LPWRETRDPYRIWVSEIMLQQTQVTTVSARYGRFLERFPTIESLAAASAEAVCEEWAGLGYYSRARNMHRTARDVVSRHAGRLPGDYHGLLALPGIGTYTAGAVASIAFGERVPAVDGNAERVLCRLFGIDSPPGPARNASVGLLAAELADCDRPGDLNQALMDLGADVCTPRSPSCTRCAVAQRCRAARDGTAAHIPLRSRTGKRALLRVSFAWIQQADGRVLLEQRALEGLWAGQWQLPGEEGPSARARLQRRLQSRLTDVRVRVRHRLSHRDVQATVYRVDWFHGVVPPRARWFDDPTKAPLSGLARKAVLAYQNSDS
jgi:A/G-specific adenine glycosylase